MTKIQDVGGGIPPKLFQRHCSFLLFTETLPAHQTWLTRLYVNTAVLRPTVNSMTCQPDREVSIGKTTAMKTGSDGIRPCLYIPGYLTGHLLHYGGYCLGISIRSILHSTFGFNTLYE